MSAIPDPDAGFSQHSQPGVVGPSAIPVELASGISTEALVAVRDAHAALFTKLDALAAATGDTKAAIDAFKSGMDLLKAASDVLLPLASKVLHAPAAAPHQGALAKLTSTLQGLGALKQSLAGLGLPV